MRKRNKKTEPNKVAGLKNDYTQEKTLEARKVKKSKRNMMRRMAFMILVGAFLISFLTIRVMQNQKRITAIKKEQAQAKTDLEEVEQQQRILENQILQLNDDEYVAKLARSEYYLSKDGEIIFSLPTEDVADAVQKAKEAAENK